MATCSLSPYINLTCLQWFSELLLGQPEWGAIFAPNGTILGVGDPIKNTALSRTLYAIAEYGSEALYSGPVAESIVRRIQETGGIITLEDLQNYFVEVGPALQGSYRGKKVYTFDAPTSGPGKCRGVPYLSATNVDL